MAAASLAPHVGIEPACRALGVSRATFYRRHRPSPGHQQPRKTPARALDEHERERVLDGLASPRFVDRSPAEVVATLLDEGQSLCSERTMYRILAAEQPVRERRNQLTHPPCTKPELVATAPNQTWSWDITRLLGPRRHPLSEPPPDPRRQPLLRGAVQDPEVPPGFPGRFVERGDAAADCSVNADRYCLNVVDRFRGADAVENDEDRSRYVRLPRPSFPSQMPCAVLSAMQEL